MSIRSRLVVCTLGDPYPVLLPASRMSGDRDHISGGERSLYELAVAAAAAGMEVELRGELSEPIFDQLTTAAGASPRVLLDARRPDRHDIVVSPEGATLDILSTAVLSDAKWIMYLLAAPGLFGWSFLPNWARPDPESVPIESLGLAATYRSIRDFGFALWTNARGIADKGAAAGVEVGWLGTGTPVPFPDPGKRTFDIAIVQNNRWAAAAEAAVSRIEKARVLRIEPTPWTYSLCDQLSQAKILVFPSRVEGMSRLAREARAVGTVPVTLDTSPFANRDDHGGGVVLTDDLDSLVHETRRLLADPERWERLSREATDSARVQAGWAPFVSRVEKAVAAIESAPPRDDAFVRSAVGHQLYERWLEQVHSHGSLVTQLRHHRTALEGQLGESRRIVDYFSSKHAQTDSDLKAARSAMNRMSGELAGSGRDLDRLSSELAAAQDEIAALTREMEAARAEAARATAEVEAFKNRRIVRAFDQSPLAMGWKMLGQSKRRPA